MDTKQQTLASWATMEELRAHLGGAGKPVSRPYVYELIAQGLPVHQVTDGARRWFDLHEVDAWLRSRCFSQQEPAA